MFTEYILRNYFGDLAGYQLYEDWIDAMRPNWHLQLRKKLFYMDELKTFLIRLVEHKISLFNNRHNNNNMLPIKFNGVTDNWENYVLPYRNLRIYPILKYNNVLYDHPFVDECGTITDLHEDMSHEKGFNTKLRFGDKLIKRCCSCSNNVYSNDNKDGTMFCGIKCIKEVFEDEYADFIYYDEVD